MIPSVKLSLIGLVALAALTAPVYADPLSGTFSGDSTLTPTATPGIYVQNFSGVGDDTVYGAFTLVSTSNVDFSSPPAIGLSGGSILDTFSQGTLFGDTSGTGTANGAGSATVTVDFIMTGGSGIFAGASGEITTTESITSTGPTTESISGSYTGSFTVAEPSSLALYALVSLVVFFRLRRSTAAR